MDTRTIEAIRHDLQWTRDQLTQQLQRLREDASHRSQPLSADAAERAQETENDEVLERLEHSTRQLVGEYDHALERLERGAYGTCETCGFLIEEERLQSVPQATRCADCVTELKQAA
jgi:DnaK suppressor protein